MNIPLRLLFYRNYHNLSLPDIANELGISIELYDDLEKGKVNPNGYIAQKLSDFYKAPIELFILEESLHHLHGEVIYYDCTFISGTGGSSGYINHQYNDRGIDEILFSKNQEIKYLKQEIERLQQKQERGI